MREWRRKLPLRLRVRTKLGICWCWIKRERCPHMSAVDIAPYIIRWGPDRWQHMLRRHGRCTACGTKGVALQHTSWGRSDAGWAPMPISQMARVPQID